jgi:hypothetical protein
MGTDLPLCVTFWGLNIPLEWVRAVEVDVRDARCMFAAIGNDVENLVSEEAASDDRHKKVRASTQDSLYRIQEESKISPFAAMLWSSDAAMIEKPRCLPVSLI